MGQNCMVGYRAVHAMRARMTAHMLYVADSSVELIGAFWHVLRGARPLALPTDWIHILAASKKLPKDCQLLLCRKRLGQLTVG